MCLDDISAENLSSTNTTVVWALGTWETVGGPAVGSIGHVKKGVLLLKTKPWLVDAMGLHELGTLVAIVELVGGSIWVPALSNHQDVWGTTEWIREDGNGAKIDIGVVAWSLASGAAVEVPLWKVVQRELTTLWDLGKSLSKRMTLVCAPIGDFFTQKWAWHTLDFDRTPPVESIQMYLHKVRMAIFV